MFRRFNKALAGVGLAVLMVGAAAAQDQPVREITHIAGDVYRFQNNFHYSVFMVTPDGIIATDPINAEAARWLEAELDKRFGKPVKYLIYSHDHADHVSGGEVFADTAVVVAHANARDHIIDDNVPTAVPELTFTDEMTVRLGGKAVELTYLGPNHGDALVVMKFPEESILFAVDIVTVDRVPYRDLPGGHVDAWIESLEAMEAMDFEILAPGHGVVGTRADIAPHRRYFEDLRAAVKKHMEAGKSLEEIKQAVTMDAYKDWGRFDEWKPLNVEGMYRYLSEQTG